MKKLLKMEDLNKLEIASANSCCVNKKTKKSDLIKRNAKNSFFGRDCAFYVLTASGWTRMHK